MAQTEPERYEELKLKLPSVTWSGKFKHRSDSNLIEHSGFVVLDVENVDLGTALADFYHHPHVYFAFVSPSGQTPKPIIPITPIPQTPREHKAAFHKVLEYFEEYVTRDPILLKKQHDVSRLCFLAYDARAIHKPDAAPIEWDPDDVEPEPEIIDVKLTRKEREIVTQNTEQFESTLLERGIAIRWHEGKSQLIAKRHCPITEHKHPEGKSVQYYKQQDGSITGFCHGCRGYWVAVNPVDRVYHKRHMKVDSTYTRPTGELREERLKLRERVIGWWSDTLLEQRKILNITTSTGTGKSHTIAADIDEFLYVSKTTEEADEFFAGMLPRVGRSDIAHRHKPRNYNQEFGGTFGLGEGQIPCIKPDLCETVLSRGHPAAVVCDHCEARQECISDGYYSQIDIELKSKIVVHAHNEEVFSDTKNAGMVGQTIGDKVLVLDEGVASRLPMHRQFNLSDIAVTIARYRGKEPYRDHWEFLSDVLLNFTASVTPRDFYDSAGYIAQQDPMFLIRIDRLLSSYPIAITKRRDGKLDVVFESESRTLPFDMVFDNEHHKIDDGETQYREVSIFALVEMELVDVANPPRSHGGMMRDLQTFYNATKHPDQAPAQREGDTWDYYLPPGLNAKRGIILSASDEADHVRQVYEGTGIEVTTIDGVTPRWSKGCKLYQIETGRYTLKQGLMDVNGQLKKQGSRMLEIIRKTADLGRKCLVVSPKAFIESEHTQTYWAHPNITAINHHRAEGRNEFQDRDIVFVFHYEPRPDVIAHMASKVYRDDELSFERENIVIKKHGVSIERERYTDPRVQSVFDRECQARLMQSASRLRPMLNEDKIVVLFTSEPVSGFPIHPITFTLDDIERKFETDEDPKTQARKLAEDGVGIDQICKMLGKSRVSVLRWIK